MIVGFTGTRRGMTGRQKQELGEGLLAVGATQLHHGDCVGADQEAHEIARRLGLRIVGHPPTDHRYRAFCECDELRSELPYLARNRVIVHESRMVIAAPEGQRRPHSGTWYTHDVAQDAGLPVALLLP